MAGRPWGSDLSQRFPLPHPDCVLLDQVPDGLPATLRSGLVAQTGSWTRSQRPVLRSQACTFPSLWNTHQPTWARRPPPFLPVSVSSSLRNQLPLCSFPWGLNGLAATRVPASTGGTCTSVLHNRGGKLGVAGSCGPELLGCGRSSSPSYTWDPPHPHLRWLSQGLLGPGHSLGKGHRTCQLWSLCSKGLW